MSSTLSFEHGELTLDSRQLVALGDIILHESVDKKMVILILLCQEMSWRVELPLLFWRKPCSAEAIHMLGSLPDRC